MITKDDTILLAKQMGSHVFCTPSEDICFDTHEQLQCFAAACYRQGVVDALSELHKHDDEFITERAIRALLEE